MENKFIQDRHQRSLYIFQDDRHIDFNSVASDTSIAQAVQQVGGK
jgi:hypothetical protein